MEVVIVFLPSLLSRRKTLILNLIRRMQRLDISDGAIKMIIFFVSIRQRALVWILNCSRFMRTIKNKVQSFKNDF